MHVPDLLFLAVALWQFLIISSGFFGVVHAIHTLSRRSSCPYTFKTNIMWVASCSVMFVIRDLAYTDGGHLLSLGKQRRGVQGGRRVFPRYPLPIPRFLGAVFSVTPVRRDIWWEGLFIFLSGHLLNTERLGIVRLRSCFWVSSWSRTPCWRWEVSFHLTSMTAHFRRSYSADLALEPSSWYGSVELSWNKPTRLRPNCATHMAQVRILNFEKRNAWGIWVLYTHKL